MKLKLKHYKTNKIKYYLKTAPFFFVFHGINLKLNNWMFIEQEFVNLKLKSYRLNNRLTKVMLFKSIFKNFKLVLNGPCFFVKISDQTYQYLEVKKKFLNINSLITFFCLRLNNKLYNFKQLQRISEINYLNSVQKLKCFLQKCLFYLFKNFFKS